MKTDGSDRKMLAENYGVHPSANRSGDLIAYVSSAGGAHHIWLINSDGQNNHQLTTGEGEIYPNISPDGQWVFYVSRAQDRGTLWKIPTIGGPAVQLTFAGIIMNPIVSPDSKKIACTYRADEGDRWKIAILPIDGGAPQQTFALPSAFYQVIRWTSDSSAITYLDKRDGAQNIWCQPLNGGSPVQLTQFKEDSILHYDWAAENRFIVSRGGRRRDVVIMKNVD
jgi:Tol biopolymer transport system component